ncbi:lasso peptide biosynthesis B2 protein [Nocardiopsis synnemataformans]|uniref:lasso peptide biosynthesis B2 protein n=1 Tax=Nocardiopsis synnemataformans TaxID=61305 RepID=UPI003EBFAB9B
MTANVCVPTDVRACDLGPAIVLVSYRSGAVQVLTGPSREWWVKAAQTGRAEESTPVVPRLLDKGVVEHGTGSERPWPLVFGKSWEPNWGTHELPMGFASHPRVPPRAHVTGAIGLILTLTTAVAGSRRKRMRRMVRLVDHASRWSRKPATRQQAEHAIHAVRRLGTFSPVRTACLEESVAATLALALIGRRGRWCHGVMADPILLHAWIEAEGEPVAEPDSTRKCAVLLELPTKENT